MPSKAPPGSSGVTAIQTDRLVLDEFRVSDAPALNAIRNDADVQAYFAKKGPESLDTTTNFIEKMGEGNRGGTGFNLAIRLKDGPVIGYMGLWAINAEEKWGEIGFLLGKEYWNKGYTKEALSAVLPILEARGDCNEIRAFVHQDNIYSLRLLARFGFELRSQSPDVPGFEIHTLAVEN